MRFVNTFSGRPAFYDRNPLQVMKSASNTQNPQGLTNQWSYTVPTARKAIVESTVNKVMRAVVATTAGTVESVMALSPNGQGAQNILAAYFVTNVVGDKDGSTSFGVGTFLAGDTIAGAYADSSTGGQVLQSVAAKIIEYDA